IRRHVSRLRRIGTAADEEQAHENHGSVDLHGLQIALRPLTRQNPRACSWLEAKILMAYWLLKTEPSTYAWDDLAREKKATWDGVSNATALMHIREMKKGDQVIIYHTGGERAAVGIAEVTRSSYPDRREDDENLGVI